MGTIKKFFHKDGRQAVQPLTVSGSVSWDAHECVARAYDDEGEEVDELRCAKVEWVEKGDVRFTGIAPSDAGPRMQLWHYSADGKPPEQQPGDSGQRDLDEHSCSV